MEKLIADAGQLILLHQQGDYIRFGQHAKNMLLELNYFRYMQKEGIDSIIDSLKRIMVHARARSSKTLDKIEFELRPLMRVRYNIYYFSYCVYPDKALMEKYYQEEMHVLGSNKYINTAVKTGEYKYKLSIAVLAYNKLEYTKQCVESILKHVPQGLNYELILINHGSTDGTKEYFEGISPTKQIDILKNGGGVAAYTSICEGKYFMLVSNDVIITENAIANMIKCMESDERIAWVVPATSNVSNYQTISTEYKTLDEMHAFAGKNNQCSDPYRWEQRTRLIDPISLRRSSVSFSSSGVNWAYYFYSELPGGFSDDKEALLYRRNGYKMMLAKDSYCHHFGSVTLKDEVIKVESFYDEGRKAFHNAFGIDPWGTGFCWSQELMARLPCRNDGHVNILGLNCGLGSNPLKIKETIKENAHNFDVTLYNVTDDTRYLQDLQGISDVAVHEPRHHHFHKLFSGVQFNYIVLEGGLAKYSGLPEMIRNLHGRLSAGGSLILQTDNQDIKNKIHEIYPFVTLTSGWCIIPKIEKFYSQYGEDLVLDALFGRKCDGFYVDVGANDPEVFNNTRLFYGKGWHGINIEPDPGCYKKLSAQRKRDINVKAGVGPQPGCPTFYRTSADTLSSFNKEAALQAGKQYGATLIAEEPTNVLTLKDILQTHLQGRRIDFLSVDTEGYDLAVLQSNDWTLYRPAVIIVEINVGGKDIIDYLQKKGYILVFDNSTNGIFIANEFRTTLDENIREDLRKLEINYNLPTILPLTADPDTLNINIVYGHKTPDEISTIKRGKINIIWSCVPIRGCDHYVYRNALNYHGKLPGLNMLLMLEPAVVLPGEFDETVWSHFDYILGLFDAFTGQYSHYRKLSFPHFDISAKVTTEDQKRRESLYPLLGRKNAVCMISGNKSSHVPGELYTKRIEIARWFFQHSKIPFEIFGRPSFDLPNYRGVIPDGAKMDVLKQYRFSLCFENIHDPVFSAGYITEKILDCLVARTVPIYLGASNIENYIPVDCFIDYRKFSGPADLDHYLQSMSEEEYQRIITAIDHWVAEGNLKTYSNACFYNLLAQLCAEASGKSLANLFDGEEEWTACPPAPPKSQSWQFINAPPRWTWNQLSTALPPVMENGKLKNPQAERRKLAASRAIDRANGLYHQGEFDSAVEALVDGIKIAFEEPQLYYELARMFIETKKFPEAWEVVGTMPEAAKNDLQGLEYAGYAKEGLGLDDDAAAYADKMLALKSQYSQALNLKGVLAYKKGHHEEAREYFQKAIAVAPDYGEAYTNLGVLYWGLDQKDEAWASLRKGFIVSPTVPDVSSLYYSVILSSGKHGEAESDFCEAVKLYPDNKNLVFLYIDLLMQQDKFKQAMRIIEDALATFKLDYGMLQAALVVREKIGPLEIDKTNPKSTLSVCMIVKNEETYLARSLRSIRDVADEIIVVDTGSTDKTKDIATAFGAKLYDLPWTGDFSVARNYSIRQASADWILILDADEVISGKDGTTLQKLISKKAGTLSAYTIMTRNYVNNVSLIGWTRNGGDYPEEQGSGWVQSTKVRLFPNRKNVSFTDPIHESLEASLQKARIPVLPCPVVIHHYGKLDQAKELQKGEDYYQLGKIKYQSDPASMIYIYELAKQAQVLDKCEEAADLWLKLITLLDQNRGTKAYSELAKTMNTSQPEAEIYTQLAAACLSLNLFDQALNASRQAMSFNIHLKEYIMIYVQCEIIAGSLQEAFSTLNTLYQKTPDYPPALFFMFVIFCLEEKKEEAKRILQSLTDMGVKIAPIAGKIARKLQTYGKRNEALLVLNTLVENELHDEETKALFLEYQKA